MLAVVQITNKNSVSATFFGECDTRRFRVQKRLIIP